LQSQGERPAKTSPDFAETREHLAIQGAARESVTPGIAADCPHCQPMAFMLLTSYIRKE
jgi:hypothetical protein